MYLQHDPKLSLKDPVFIGMETKSYRNKTILICTLMYVILQVDDII